MTIEPTHQGSVSSSNPLQTPVGKNLSAIRQKLDKSLLLLIDPSTIAPGDNISIIRLSMQNRDQPIPAGNALGRFNFPNGTGPVGDQVHVSPQLKTYSRTRVIDPYGT